MQILTSICFVCFGRLEVEDTTYQEESDEAWAVKDWTRMARYVHNIPSTLRFTEVDSLLSSTLEWTGEGDDTDDRFAWVYRWLGVTHDYYVNTSTIRRTKEMMKKSARNVKTQKEGLERNVFSG